MNSLTILMQYIFTNDGKGMYKLNKKINMTFSKYKNKKGMFTVLLFVQCNL